MVFSEVGAFTFVPTGAEQLFQAIRHKFSLICFSSAHETGVKLHGVQFILPKCYRKYFTWYGDPGDTQDSETQRMTFFFSNEFSNAL